MNPEFGRVGLEGLRALYLSLGMDPSDDSLQINLEQMDKSGTGTISLEDFINSLWWVLMSFLNWTIFNMIEQQSCRHTYI